MFWLIAQLLIFIPFHAEAVAIDCALSVSVPSGPNQFDGDVLVQLRDADGIPIRDQVVNIAGIPQDHSRRCYQVCGSTDDAGVATCIFACPQSGAYEISVAEPAACLFSVTIYIPEI